jgi:excinuclease ABC subunit A
VLDEPSVGLHAADVERLISVLQALVEQGNTVVIIEHNPDIIKVADWLIDIGPEGGDRGGEVVAVGTPEQVAQVAESYTGQFLANYLMAVR